MLNEMIKTRAIIVRTANSGDNDRVLTAVSPELGKITVIAKGVRSLRNRNGAAVGLLCYSELVLKEGRELYSLSSADCVEGFYHLRESVEGVAYGAYFAALLEDCTERNSPAAEEVRLLLNTLYVLMKRPEDAAVLKTVYELRLCEILGLAPYISPECRCGRTAEFFDIALGETCCESCKEASALPITKDEMLVLEYILTSDLKDALFFKTPEPILKRLAPMTEKYLEYHVGRPPKQLEYLKSVLK